MLHTQSLITIKNYIIRAHFSSVPNFLSNCNSQDCLPNLAVGYTDGAFSPSQHSGTVVEPNNKIPPNFDSTAQIERFISESRDYKSRSIPEYDPHQDKAREQHWKHLVWICSDGKESSKL